MAPTCQRPWVSGHREYEKRKISRSLQDSGRRDDNVMENDDGMGYSADESLALMR